MLADIFVGGVRRARFLITELAPEFLTCETQKIGMGNSASRDIPIAWGRRFSIADRTESKFRS